MGYIETKYKNNEGQWVFMLASDCYGNTLQQLFEVWQGADVVSKLESDKGRAMLCGTQQWVDHYKARGEKAFTFEQALAYLQNKGNVPWLHDVLIPNGFAEAFADVDGIEIMKIEWQDQTEMEG